MSDYVQYVMFMALPVCLFAWMCITDSVHVMVVCFVVAIPQDYPSVSMVNSLLVENGISPIFLVTSQEQVLYQVRIYLQLAYTLG